LWNRRKPDQRVELARRQKLGGVRRLVSTPVDVARIEHDVRAMTREEEMMRGFERWYATPLALEISNRADPGFPKTSKQPT